MPARRMNVSRELVLQRFEALGQNRVVHWENGEGGRVEGLVTIPPESVAADTRTR